MYKLKILDIYSQTWFIDNTFDTFEEAKEQADECYHDPTSIYYHWPMVIIDPKDN